MGDKNFDDLAHKLDHNIYSTPKGAVRLEVLYKDLLSTLPHLHDKPLRVLDAGGGLGQFSRLLAKEGGHHILHIDISSEMLKKAEQEADVQGLKDLITFKKISIQELPSIVEESFDLILFHGVIEWMEEQEQSLENLKKVLKDDGHLSLLFYNRDRLILKNGVNAHFKRIHTGDYIGKRTGNVLTPTHPLRESEVKLWLSELKFDILSKGGIRIFYGLFSNGDEFEDRIDQLKIVEWTYCRIEPYASIAQHIHFVCKGQS
ncbi:methyltransferase domain-containing protein [Spirochaeta cellobiosiphila]|uniref:methyltransferase domain-containing protein n=1 Tax=Spirochaeta cellobiosiphila TaxID=504483 RepID=UPI0003F7AC25|nr:methyltransferase domain-containing protein [Spirochaeta cellobiosiphila]